MTEIKPSKQIDEVVAAVMDILNKIDQASIQNIGGDKLTEIAIRLAQYKAYLGGEVAELDYSLKMMEAVREGVWTDNYSEAKKTEEKMTDKMACSLADTATREQKMEGIELGRKFNKIKNLRQDIGDLITVLQSRIGHLKSEKIDSMLPNIR